MEISRHVSVSVFMSTKLHPFGVSVDPKRGNGSPYLFNTTLTSTLKNFEKITDVASVERELNNKKSLLLATMM